MNLATATEASIGTRSLNSIHLGSNRVWRRPSWPTVAELQTGSTIYSTALSASGTVAAVSDPLGVKVYDISGSIFQQKGATVNNATNVALSASGNLLATSDPKANNFSGIVKIYEWNGTEWIQKGQDIGPTTGSRAGDSLTISPDEQKIIFGETSLTGTGIIRTVEWNGTSWSNVSQYNSPFGEYFGVSGLSLSEDGSTLVATSPYSNAPDYNSGRVRVFEWSANAWTPAMDFNGTHPEQYFGRGGAIISGNKIIVGTPDYGLPNGYSVIEKIGKVSIFEKIGASWVEQTAFTGAATSIVGVTVSIRGDRIFVVSNAGGRTAGVLRIYDLTAGQWVEVVTSKIPAQNSGISSDGLLYLGSSLKYLINGITGNSTRPFLTSNFHFLALKAQQGNS
jgi:hypothetical protein